MTCRFVLSPYKPRMDSNQAYLPGAEVNHDHEGGSSRMRLSHCTSGWLTPTMVSNVDHLSAQFLLVGDCVRAIPQIMAEANGLVPSLRTEISKFWNLSMFKLLIK